ncbi:bifunctional DNA primase/polymerase [Nostoc sp. 'Peltigera membranacea cyanobiont' N6]|uniref:bifunctional DNA primase/polymerase n=1 Tax=Nostoc sp. 'Peltigera membranacea cyanobiont' N6 TaxID=1261031 RepID=UPI000CF309B8|nr:bifunctional DNA primase/polymerase [Nostoc sp. 'Peltigera membranacea cyanobiont' N6]AVH68651.1 bifunctional DNA primase/polymerase [Nostoc sp. 'Peltigera membranacea cyanobiont' N6]
MTYQEDLASSRSSLSLNSFSNSENGSHPSITGSTAVPSISAKFNPFKRIANAEEIAKGVESIPSHWSLTTVQVKAALRDGWQIEEFIPQSEIARLILHGDDAISKKTGKPYHRYWSGFAARLGEASQGLIDIDVDGYSAHPLLERLSNGDLPNTVSSTSGKPGRYHLFYQIPDDVREKLKEFTRWVDTEFEGLKTAVDADGKPTELLEFRYNRLQTVLPPSFHPTTGSNKWINSPETTEVAIAPKWLCDYIISRHELQKLEAKERTDRAITLKAERKDYSNGNDLVSFLNDEVLQRLSPEQIFNWQGHDFRQFGSTLKGNPPWRDSASGTSFHVWIDNQGLPAWQDKGTGEGGNAVQYRHKLNGGVGTPKGKEWFDIAKQLTDEAGLQLPKRDFKPVESNLEPEIKAEYKKTDYELKVESEQKRLNTLTIKEHWEQLKYEGRFLNENLLEKIPYSGITLLPLPMGVGKSTFVNKIIKKYPDRRVLSITPTTALGRGQADNWGLTLREDAQAQGVSSGLILANTERLVLCYPSLHKLSGTEGDERFSNIDNKGLILILDEAEEGLGFLMQSSITNQQGKRAYNIAALKDLLKNAKEQGILVIVADANLKNPAVDYLTKILPDLPVTVITSDYKPERGTATYYDTEKSVFENALKEAVERGERVIIPCDSQEHGEALDKKLTAMGHKVVRCDRTTASGEDMKAFIADPDKFIAEVQPQVVIYSPTLGSGASIQASQEYAEYFQKLKQLQTEEVTEDLAQISENWERLTPYFNQRFAYNYHLIPPLFRQLIGRYRHPIPTSYWCGKDLPITGCKSPLPSEQLRQVLAHEEGLKEVWKLAQKEVNTDDSLDILKTMNRIMTEAYMGKNPELVLWAEQRARECFFHVNRWEKLIDELKNDGYTVKVVSEELEEGEQLEDSEFGDEVKEIKEEARKELAASVVTAPIIPEEDYKFLDSKPSLSPEERVYVDRYRFEQQLPGLLDDLGDNAANFYYHAKLKDKLHWINALRLFHSYTNQDALRENDLKSFDFAVQRFEKSGVAALQDNRKLKTGFFDFIRDCGLMDAKNGVDLNDLSKEYTAESFTNLLSNFRGKYKTKVKTYFDAVPLKKENEEKAIPWINKRLAGFALRLKLSRKDSDDVRHYKLVSEIPEWADESIQNKIFNILDTKIDSNVDTESVIATAVNPGDNIQPLLVTAGDFEHTTNIEEISLVVHSDTPKATVFDKAKEIMLATFSPHVIAIAKQIKEFGQASAKALEQLTEIDLLAIQEVVMGSKNYIDADDLPEDYEF